MRDVMLLLGVFLGGATPWLEAIVVIPGGILAGGHPVPVVVAGVTGNLLTVAVAALFGERIRKWWQARRAARQDGVPAGSARSRRVERVLFRYGLPVLAVLGPVVIGTQLSAVAAVSLGTDRRATFLWIAGGTVGWAIAAAVATLAGVSIFTG